VKGFALGFILAFIFLAVDGRAKGEFRQVPKWWIPQALCVHSYEGSWRDPNPPYYGGLQMDLGFQRAYGADILRRFGTADHWHPKTQMIVAYRGWKQRSWSPWPNTARRCGLI
jgi:hypothetical protein